MEPSLLDWLNGARSGRRLRPEQRRAPRGARWRPWNVVAAVPCSRNYTAEVARAAVPVDVSAERVAEDLVVAGIENLACTGVVRRRVGVRGPAEPRDGVPRRTVPVRAVELQPLVGSARCVVYRDVALEVVRGSRHTQHEA